MKKNILYSILLMASTLPLLPSCKKDLGNYNYQAINEISFPNIITDSNYSVYLGDTLRIAAEATGSLDKTLSGSYSYEWTLLTNADNKMQSISKDKDLNLPVTLQPGNYNLSYSVKDNTTGVTWFTKIALTVITPYYQGWLVLSKTTGEPRLDFINYYNSTFSLKKDLLTILNSGVPPQGDPHQILYYSSGSKVAQEILGGVQLVTATGTYFLDRENYSYLPDKDITKVMLGSPPPDFKVDKLIYSKGDLFSSDNIFLISDGNMYKNMNGLFSYVPLNLYNETALPFKMAPYIATSGGTQTMIIVYNEDEKRFMNFRKQSGSQYNKADYTDPALNFPAGKDLLYMTDNDAPAGQGTNYGYAVLKEPGMDKFYMVRFTLQNYSVLPVNYNEEIVATDFALAEHYAVSPDLGYLLYTVGGKVYEYDLFLKTSKLMLDLGPQQISLLGFDTNRKPAAFSNLLIIGSYDPAGQAGANGTLALYSVPTVNGNFVEQYKWTGFGEITSLSWRTR